MPATLPDDPILSGYLDEFSKNFGLPDQKPSEIFEGFSAYCSIFRDFSDQVEIDDIVVAGGNDTGIDGIGIFLNGVPVNSVEQADLILGRGRAECDFAFFQSKIGRSIDGGELSKFLDGIMSFFSDLGLRENDDIKNKKEVKDRIFSNSTRIRNRPRVKLYYCYLGNYKHDQDIQAKITAGVDRIKQLNIADIVELQVLDRGLLERRYQENLLRIEKEILLSDYADLPEIGGIERAYLGVLQASELVKLISNSDGNLQKSLFNENIRDFLKDNPVNNAIARTLSSAELQDKLPALNNGITIVCREIKPQNKKFLLTDFQIVNGCQTSHLIFYNQEKISKRVCVPVKIIQVADRELINEIVRATNSQTEVKNEAFVALGEYHKRLERFFESIDVPHQKKGSL